MSEVLARLIQRGADEQVHALGPGRHVLGRERGLELVLEHADVSRRHAELRVSEDGAWIRDLGSKNGLRVDGVAVRGEVELPNRAKLEIGELRLDFEHRGARLDDLLARSGEATIRRPLPVEAPVAESPAPAPLLLPLLAVAAFAAMTLALLLFG